MNIRGVNNASPLWDAGNNAGVADAVSIILDINKKSLRLKKSNIRDIAKGLAEIAYSMGETNNPEDFATLISEDIIEGFTLAEKRRREKKKKRLPN